jgi:hypothetical protein
MCSKDTGYGILFLSVGFCDRDELFNGLQSLLEVV